MSFESLIRTAAKTPAFFIQSQKIDEIVKIQNSEESTLTKSECESMEMLKKNCNVEVTTIDDSQEDGDSATNPLKRRRTVKESLNLFTRRYTSCYRRQNWLNASLALLHLLTLKPLPMNLK